MFRPIAAAVIFGAVVISVTLALGCLVGTLGRADGNVQAALLTALIGVVAVVIGRVWDTKSRNEVRRREKMDPIYDALIGVFQDIADSEGEIDQKTIDRFAQIQQEMLVWAPTHVIKQVIAWRAVSMSDDLSPREGLLSWEKVLLAMRRDVGNESSGLSEGDLLRVFVNDWDELQDDN